MTTQAKTKWQLKGDVMGGCNCDFGCPCTFDAPPTYGFCEGVYFIHINEGSFGGTSLDGLTVGLGAHSPAALHLGNLTTIQIIDEKASAAQRQALESLLRGDGGGVLGIFASLTTKTIGPVYAPTEWELDSQGYAGRCRLGDFAEVVLEPIKNPVTGVASAFTVLLGNGLMTDREEMGSTTLFRMNHPELSFAHPGKFGSTFKIDWKGGG